jgi:hypothetical protein
MSKLQWTLFTFTGIIFIVSVNVWAAIRDDKLLQHYTTYPELYHEQRQSLPTN